MKYVTILDTETTGLDPATDRVIEVGAILYDVAAACPVTHYATLVRADANPAAHVNRIPEAALASAAAPATAWREVGAIIESSSAVIAHRAEFDRSFTPEHVRDMRPWICSKFDLAWPRSKPGASLVEVALSIDLGVAYAHRALTDCDLLARSFTRLVELGHDLHAFLERGLRPKATFQALVSYDDRDKAKALGFRWDAPSKRWLKTMAIEDAGTLGIKVQQVAA